jgi:hypothetical protein
MVGLACVANAASASPADARGGKKKPKAKAASEAKSGFSAPSETSKAQPAPAGKKGKGCSGGSSATQAKMFVDQPGTEKKRTDGTKGPKWVCENSEITLDPVWRGKPLHFPFKIRNDGDEDLRISARGG